MLNKTINKQFLWDDTVPLDERVRTFRKKQCLKVKQSKKSRYGTNHVYLKKTPWSLRKVWNQSS